jgi:hypothetical protein
MVPLVVDPVTVACKVAQSNGAPRRIAGDATYEIIAVEPQTHAIVIAAKFPNDPLARSG